jgi:hypothetical protein
MRTDVRYAVVARDDGLRKIGKFTRRAGAAAAICSGVIALAFGHHSQPASASNSRSGSVQTPSQPASNNSGSIQVPAQPPGPGQGAGQVTSGAS